MKYTLLIFISFFHFYAKAQDTLNLKHLITSIETQSDVDSLQRTLPYISILKTTKNSNDSDFNPKFKHLEEGESKQTDKNTFVKLISKNTTLEFKVKYVFLDANKIGVEKAKSIQNEIINLFNKGESFGDLANQHSMDPRKNNGDLDWFPKGRMVSNFEAAIIKHKKGDIFKTEDLTRNWYFVVLKTHNQRESGEYDYVEITEHKIELLQNKENLKKELKAFIQFTINENQSLSKVHFKKVTCNNCTQEDLKDPFLMDSFTSFLSSIEKRISKGDLKQNENYTLPVKLLIE